jgi:hypothetical protein
MTKRRPRDIGTEAETAVVRYLVKNGFPHAERRSLKGSFDQGDITGTPGICWEVKGGEKAKRASDGQILLWLDETETERVNSRENVGVLVVQRAGIGLPNAGRWWAILPLEDVVDLSLPSRPLGMAVPLDGAPVRMHLSDAVELLRAAGYGEELEASA